jgi:tetraacyldisaccharide 4'-kinase
MTSKFVNKFWYTQNPLRWVLYPFALLFQASAAVRRFALCRFYQHKFSVPIIVVGNITVGGAGKTPLVIAIASELKRQGLRVGVVSRGYGASIRHFPHLVQPDSDAYMVGDEPLLIAQKTDCPVVIAPDRVKAVQYLLEKFACQIVISDDGLQHYRMSRSVEIVVIDGERGLGNRMCLPAGPLRESARRLHRADLLVANGGQWENAHSMELKPGLLTSLIDGRSLKQSFSISEPVAAVAGIGHPKRFFNTLTALGVSHHTYPFPDHHRYSSKDLQLNEKIIVMTEKDAVKCKAFATPSMYFLPVEAKISNTFWNAFWSHEQLQGYRK